VGREFARHREPDCVAEQSPTVLERVRRLRGVKYEWKSGSGAYHPPGKTHEMGVIAQEVQSVFPEAVMTDEDGLLMVDYSGLVAALIEAVKELADRVDALEARAGSA
jgi:hypothetical protein